MSKALKTRLERLERHKVRHELPRLVWHIHGRDDQELTGYRSRNVVAMRSPGEPLAELQARAWALGASLQLEALYRPENRPVAAVAEPVPVAPSPADPFALAGIGRRATLEELIKAGAIRVPPERLI